MMKNIRKISDFCSLLNWYQNKEKLPKKSQY